MGLPALSGDVTSSQDTEDMGVATLPKNGKGPASKSRSSVSVCESDA